MWFKNLTVVKLEEPFKLSPEELDEKLQTHKSKPCGMFEQFSLGWSPPLGKDGEMLVHAASGYYMLTARKEVKLLPAGVIKEHLQEKISEIEEKLGRKVGRREKESLRDEVINDLAPRAFHRSVYINGYIDTRNNYLIINTANIKTAESFIELLRQSLGSFTILWPQVSEAPHMAMSNWLLHKTTPDTFVIEDHCEMVDKKGEGALVRCVKQDMTADEIGEHLRAGKQVTQLALTWQERISFVVSEKLLLKRLRYLELITAEAQDMNTETKAEKFDADFAIMTSALAGLIPAVFDLFGGLAEQ